MTGLKPGTDCSGSRVAHTAGDLLGRILSILRNPVHPVHCFSPENSGKPNAERTELNVYYGDSHVIRNVSFEVRDGETLAIMGRNGMGKTTLLKSLIGILLPASGTIALRAGMSARPTASTASPRGWATCRRGA